MKRGWCRRLVGVLSLGFLAAALSATAQDQGGRRGGDRGGDRGGPGGWGGRMNPEEMRQRMETRIKEALEVKDEEWQVLQPLVQAVSEKQRDSRRAQFGGMGMWGGGRGGPDGGRGGPQATEDPDTPEEVKALRTALENKETPAKDLQDKLTAFRAGRQKREDALKTARDELRKVLSARQEATLVMMGLLD